MASETETLSSRSGGRWATAVTIFVLVTTFGALRDVSAQREDYNNAPIHYETAEVNDPVALLARRVEAGDVRLEYEGSQGYLASLLEALDVPVSSQSLVFSKTSMQISRISPDRPRAVYFNDDVYVGYCQQGKVIELAATDPEQGAIFYTLEQSEAGPPEFVRDRGQCLACHASSRTQNVPGYLIRSVYANQTGRPEFGSGTFTTDHTSPFEQRWGGWYVTGAHGDMRHMGNALFDKRKGDLDREAHANLASLEGIVDTRPYPGEHSDIVALMVMEHQTQMHNAIAYANYETRRAIHLAEVMNRALDRPEGFLSDSSRRRIDRAADHLLEYLLMCGEFPLTDRVEGASRFTEEFQRRGPRTHDGRSLRDFDLQTRLFRYPCSYLIDSDAFEALPDEVRTLTLEKLHRILDDDDTIENADRYAHLSKADREAIKQILLETKPEFAETAK